MTPLMVCLTMFLEVYSRLGNNKNTDERDHEQQPHQTGQRAGNNHQQGTEENEQTMQYRWGWLFTAVELPVEFAPIPSPLPSRQKAAEKRAAKHEAQNHRKHHKAL